jgi:hypothetical protein
MRMADLITPMIQIGAVAAPAKVTKEGAGYIHRDGTDYRCRDCVLFIPKSKRCAIHRNEDLIQPNGYCTQWAEGKPQPGLVPLGCYTPKETGYGELRNGTKCVRCVFFNGSNDCKRVNKDSSGDDPGSINPNACCANQQPRVNV